MVNQDTNHSRRVRSGGQGAEEAIGRAEEFAKLVATVEGAEDKVKIDMMAKNSMARRGEEGAMYQDMWYSVVVDASRWRALVAWEVRA